MRNFANAFALQIDKQPDEHGSTLRDFAFFAPFVVSSFVKDGIKAWESANAVVQNPTPDSARSRCAFAAPLRTP